MTEKNIFEEIESEVRSYARSVPAVFERAENACLFDREGNRYLDFFAGAGSLNYGHNNPHLRGALIEYIQSAGVTLGLDFHTVAKEEFLHAFREIILKPRNMDYRIQFTGPTGANAVEAALKLARKLTGRSNVIAFTNGFHGVTMGALGATGNAYHRGAAGIALGGFARMPYDGYMGEDFDTIAYMDRLLSDGSSGIDHPAAVLVETIQGEGGLNTARFEWLQRLEELCRKYEMLLIADDIQAGCGRTGTFFSFEDAGISPDIITLSKSLSAYGLPFALTIFKPEHDQWKPGEHNGTFRGNNHAFVTATAALRHYWQDGEFAAEIRRKGDIIGQRIDAIIAGYPEGTLAPKGRGMMRGIQCESGKITRAVKTEALKHRLIIETSGADAQVLKCLCPLITTDEELKEGWDIVEQSFATVLGKPARAVA